jgi:hypothetical protein
MVRWIKFPATYPHRVTGYDSQMPSVKKKKKNWKANKFIYIRKNVSLIAQSVLFGNKVGKFVPILYASFYVFLEEH